MSEPFRPTRPAGAYDDLLARVLPRARTQPVWQQSGNSIRSVQVA